jgi:hypothetical protein
VTYYTDEKEKEFIENIKEEKKRFSGNSLLNRSISWPSEIMPDQTDA